MDNVDAIINCLNCSNPNSILSIEAYNEEGKRDLKKLADIVDKMDNYISIEDMKLMKDILDYYEGGHMILFKMLEVKIGMMEKQEKDNCRNEKFKSLGSRLKPMSESDL